MKKYIASCKVASKTILEEAAVGFNTNTKRLK